MTANELADGIENCTTDPLHKEAATMLRQQQAEIEALKNANRFIQNFAQEQHQRAVALEMRELTDEEIADATKAWFNIHPDAEWRERFEIKLYDLENFAKAILRKASEK